MLAMSQGADHAQKRRAPWLDGHIDDRRTSMATAIGHAVVIPRRRGDRARVEQADAPAP
jgi:hypothetical protein